MRNFGVIVWQGSIGADYRSQHENRRVRAVILSMVFDGTKKGTVLLQTSIAPRAAREQFSMDGAQRTKASESRDLLRKV